MSKVERELTDAEILEWATKDFVLAETKGTLVSTNDANAQGQMPYGIDTSSIWISGNYSGSNETYNVFGNFPLTISRYQNDGNRRIGYISSVNTDGSFNIYILGSGNWKVFPTHYVSTLSKLGANGRLRLLPPATDLYFPEHASDFGNYIYEDNASGQRWGFAYDNTNIAIGINQAFEYGPQWKDQVQSRDSCSVFYNTMFVHDNMTIPDPYQQNIQLTNDISSTVQIGRPIMTKYWQRSQAGWYFGDKNIGGDIFDFLDSMGLSLVSSLANTPASSSIQPLTTHGYSGDYNSTMISTYQPFEGSYAFNYTPYNLILTYDLDAAKNYVNTGELPSDAFIYPFDVDNIPVNADGGTGADDTDGTQDTVDTGDTTFEDTDDQSPSAPGQNGQSLTNNNLYWLTSQQLKRFLDWFWDEATDVTDPSELFEKIQGLYENLSEAIVAVRYMPVRPEWIGGVSTDTKIIVGMLEKAEQCRVINKVVPDIQTIGSIDIRELAKDNKTWDGFLNYSPYCQMSLYLPFHGFIDLDADLIMNSKLSIKAAYDILTGTIQYFIYRTARGTNNLNLVNTVVAKMATDIPISLQTKTQRDSAIFQNVSSAAGNLIGAGASLATGNPIGMVMSTANIAATQPTGAPLTLKGTISENGAYYDSALCAIYVKRPGINIPSNYDRKVGNPCNVAMKLSQVHGFVKCENPFISFSEVTSDNSLGFPPPKPTKDEIDTIYNALSEGVILP